MKIYRSTAELQKYISAQRNQGLSIALVPTLGCLHVGHQSLFETARNACDIVIASVFVNPLQFRQDKYESYPKDHANDKALAEKKGVDGLFMPTAEEMYPDVHSNIEFFNWHELPHQRNETQFIKQDINNCPIYRVPSRLTNKMDGSLHAWHFDGVVTVVHKLFQIISPDQAYFGEKDPQQLAIIEQLTQHYHSNVTINRVATVRESSGLAYSSRNSLLNSSQRQLALQAHSALAQGLERLHAGERDGVEVVKGINTALTKLKKIDVEYIGLVDKNTLSPVKVVNATVIFYLAYLIDGIRLTDTLMFKL